MNADLNCDCVKSAFIRVYPRPNFFFNGDPYAEQTGLDWPHL